MKHFFQNVEKWPEPYFATFDPQKVIIAHDEAAVRAIVQRMRRPIAWDIETSTLRPFATDAKILTSAFSDGDLTVAFACQHPAEPNDWGLSVVKDIVSSTPVICHNAAFEMLWYCAYFGLEALPRQFHDTMVLARLIREQPGLLSLAVLSRIYLGVNVKQISHIDAARVLEYPLPDVLQYNGLDAEATALLFHCLDGRADDWQVNKVLCTIRSTTAMELVGLPVDLEKTKALNDEWEARSAAAEAKARILQEVRRFGVYEGKSFNIQSGKHVATGLIKYGGQMLPKTDKGADSTKREYLEALADSHPLAQLVCDYREANKLISTYIKPILSGTELAADGRIHPGYTTCHTATLRLSGNNMNIQNWPKRKHREIRKQIVAPKGQLIVSIDYGQIEARVIAMASRDRVLCDSIITGYDIHADWRDRLLKLYPKYIDRLIAKSGKTDDKSLMKAGRDNIKNDFVFASFFGSSPESCAKYTGLPLEVMQELSADFWDTFRGVRGWIKSQRRIHAETGTTSTLTGRVRRGEMEGNECINTPIQGTAADIVISAQNEVFDLSQSEHDPYLMPRIQVHDDLTFFLPDDNTRLDYYFKRISDILLKRRFSFFNVPLMVEVSVGHNWADTTEVVKYTGDYYK